MILSVGLASPLLRHAGVTQLMTPGLSYNSIPSAAITALFPLLLAVCLLVTVAPFSWCQSQSLEI